MPQSSRALRIVAWLFIASGVWAAISIAGALLIQQHANLDIEVLGLWIGPGLLRYDARYRLWALRLLLLGLCLAPVAAVLVALQSGPLFVRVFDRPIGTASPSFVIAMLASTFVLAAWQYRVLRRPDIEALFAHASSRES